MTEKLKRVAQVFVELGESGGTVSETDSVVIDKGDLDEKMHEAGFSMGEHQTKMRVINWGTRIFVNDVPTSIEALKDIRVMTLEEAYQKRSKILGLS